MRQRDVLSANLATWVKYLAPTYVKILFFKASDMETPLLLTTLGKNKEWLVAPGIDTHYAYAYAQSDMVYMVSNMRIKNKRTIALYTADVHRSSTRGIGDPKEIAYLGNHVDFSIHDNLGGDVHYRTHWTYYVERVGRNLEFDRHVAMFCNFRTPGKPFAKTVCVNEINQPVCSIDKVCLKQTHREIVEDFWKASNGKLGGGGGPGQSGGTRLHGDKKYEGVGLFDRDFYKFMDRSIFSKLWLQIGHHVPERVCVFFDQENELDGAAGNKALHYVVEIRDYSAVAFSVSTHRALKACWTDANLSIASMRERRALGSWNRSCAELLRAFS